MWKKSSMCVYASSESILIERTPLLRGCFLFDTFWFEEAGGRSWPRGVMAFGFFQYFPLFSPSFPWDTHYPFSIKTLSSNPHEKTTPLEALFFIFFLFFPLLVTETCQRGTPPRGGEGSFDQYVGGDSSICVTCLIDMCNTTLPCLCNMPHPCVWHDLPVCRKWLIRMCDMTHLYEWHDSSVCRTWLIHMCDMTHPYVWHALQMCTCHRVIHKFIGKHRFELGLLL